MSNDVTTAPADMARMAESSKFFDTFLGYVPPSYYIQEDEKPALPKDKKARAKAQKKEYQAKFDPANYRTVVDVQTALAQSVIPTSPSLTHTHSSAFLAALPSLDLAGLPQTNGKKGSKKGARSPATSPLASPDVGMDALPLSAQASVTLLNDRLKARMAELRNKRKRGEQDEDDDDDADGNEGPSKKQLKKAKQAAKAEAEKKAKKKASKKAKMVEKKEKIRAEKKEAAANGNATGTDDESEKKRRSAEQQLAEDASDIIFGAQQPANGAEAIKAYQFAKKKKLNPKQQLHLLEKKEAEAKELAASDPELAAKMASEASLASALAKAQGLSMRDDKALLKKSIKRKEADKRKSSKEWKDRAKATDKDKKERIAKRNENVNADITKKKEAFQARMDKQKRARAGFEGPGKFLN